MSVAELFLYSDSGSPVRHRRVDCQKCLQLLLPQLQECRRTARNSKAVAEVCFDNGLAVKFSSQDGNIVIKEERPMFGSSRRLLGFIPLPVNTKNHADTSEFSIHKIMARAYGPG